MAQVEVKAPPATKRIEDPDEPFLKEAEDIAIEFIALGLPREAAKSSLLKAPHYPKKTEGEPELLRSEEGEPPQAEPTATELPASLPRLGQRGSSQVQANGQVQGEQSETPGAARLIAEKLKAIGDSIDEEIRDGLSAEFDGLFKKTSVFDITRERFESVCALVLVKFQSSFHSGWQQAALIYSALSEVIVAVRREAGGSTMQSREQQSANFVGPTMANLGISTWISNHGGMGNVGSNVEGSDATAIIESSVDRES